MRGEKNEDKQDRFQNGLFKTYSDLKKQKKNQINAVTIKFSTKK